METDVASTPDDERRASLQRPARLPAPRRWRLVEAARLETPALTAAYWIVVALYVAAFWIPRFPPLVDYPQHLAIAALLRRWFDPTSPERQLYDVNLVTYNGAFHLAVALLGFVVPIETAGRIVLSLVPVLFGSGALALMRAAQRPRAYALLVLPLSFNAMVTWGFLNNTLSYGVALLAVSLLYRARRTPREPRLYAWGAALGLIVAYTHIFGAFILCASVGLIALRELVVPRAAGPGAAGPGADVRARLRTFVKTCAALVPAAALSAFFVLHNRSSSYSNWENAVNDGIDEYAWRKIAWFADLVIGNFADRSDRRLFYLLLAALAFLWWPRKQVTPGHKSFRWLAGIYFVLYLITPRVLFATWFIFERIAFIFLVFLVAATPVVSPAVTRWVRVFAAFLALSTAINVDLRLARIPEEDDANAILEAIPPGSRVVGLMWEPTAWPIFERQMWVHFQAYYLVRHGGEATPSFTFIESLPVHYKADRRPPRRGAGSEWSPETYSVLEPYARYFETVLVMAPRDEADPARLVFHGDARRAKVLAHHGRFWLYDASAIVRDVDDRDPWPPAEGR